MPSGLIASDFSRNSLRLLVAAEAHRETRHLVIERAEAGVGRALQRIRIDLQRRLQLRPGLLRQAQCTQPTLHAGGGAEHDAFPDERLGPAGVARRVKAAACASSLSKAASLASPSGE